MTRGRGCLLIELGSASGPAASRGDPVLAESGSRSCAPPPGGRGRADITVAPADLAVRPAEMRTRTYTYKESANWAGPSRANPRARLFESRVRQSLLDEWAWILPCGWRRRATRILDTALRPYDALAKRCLQPLGHLSGASLMHLIAWAGQFGACVFARISPNDFPQRFSANHDGLPSRPETSRRKSG